MPEAVAPAAPTQTAPSTAKPPAQKLDEGAPKEPPKTEQPTGDDPRELWKKAVKGKAIKHKGVEKPLEEFDPDEAAEMIRRGYGASELVAEAKKRTEQAEKVLSLKKAIEEGDDDAALRAVYELGGERGLKLLDKLRAQVAQRQQETEQMTPREREMAERAARAEEQAAELAREKAAREEAEAKKADEQEMLRTRQEGLQKTQEVLKLVKGFPVEKAEMVLPYVARAWREVLETGAELGRDVPPEAIVKRAEQLFRQSTSGFYAALSPAEQFEFLGEEAVAKLSAELVRRRRGGVAKPAVAAQAPKTKPTGDGRELVGLGDPRYLMR